MQTQSCSSAVAPFSFESHQVRTLEIANEPWFVGKDVAVVLGYQNPQQAICNHCKYAKPVGVLDSLTPLDLDPQTVIIPRGDAYRLIVKSTLPAADKFECWLMNEVVPAIHKTGSYTIAQPIPDVPTDPMAILKLMFDAQNQCHCC